MRSLGLANGDYDGYRTVLKEVGGVTSLIVSLTLPHMLLTLPPLIVSVAVTDYAIELCHSLRHSPCHSLCHSLCHS